MRKALELDEVPDHTTISWMLKRLTLSRLEAMVVQVLSAVKRKEDVVAIDTTGFRFTQAAPTTPPVADENTAIG